MGERTGIIIRNLNNRFLIIFFREEDMERIPNNDLGYAIGRTARILYRLLDGNLRSLVLSFSQVNVLGYLAAKHARGEECTQKLIATECCSTRPSSVTGLLQALERQGYIERRAGEDARVKCVALTERGKEVADECSRFVQKTEDAMRRGLSEEETKTVFRCLLHMADELEALSKETFPETGPDQKERKQQDL